MFVQLVKAIADSPMDQDEVLVFQGFSDQLDHGAALVEKYSFFQDEMGFKITAVRLNREQIQLVVDSDAAVTGIAARKGLLQGHLLEKRDRQNL